MKKIYLILTVAVFTFFTFGCSNNNEKATDKTSEKIAEKFIEGATGNKVDVDIDKSNNTGSMTIKGDNGDAVTISSDGKKIPDNFPSDIYLAEGDIASVGTIDTGDGSIITILMNVKEDTGTTADKILKEMKAAGWKIDMNMKTSEGDVQMYSKGNNSLTVTVGKDHEQTSVNYMATISEK
ncbi:MAG: hypothetical protein GXO80_10135 [Chlorobi bacterium]|nr:hypothetical protein [Chlorobiota bacterium]